MSSKLERMRQKLKETETRGGGGGDGAQYPFWNTPDGKTCSLRFIEDKDPENEFFWRERQVYKWDFVDPDNPQGKIEITIPCVEMWDGPRSCPAKPVFGQWFDADENDERARKLWVKRSYIYQGFVRRSAFEEENGPPDNPIRIFTLNKTIHTIIKNSILTTDEDKMMEELPTDEENGRDFIIEKLKDGKWASYSTSSWAQRTTPLHDDELAALEEYEAWDLSERIGKRPSDEALALLPEMLVAAYDGEPWNPDWEVYFKPWRPNSAGGNKRSDGDDDDNGVDNAALERIRAKKAAAAERKAASAKPKVEEVEDVEEAEDDVVEETAEAEAPAKSSSGQDVLERLRAKRAAKSASA